VVIHDGHPYAMPPDAIGLPGTLYLYCDSRSLSADHARANSSRARARSWQEHRGQRVAAVSGKRARRYLQRHLIDRGAAGAGLPQSVDPSPPAHLDSRRRAPARPPTHLWDTALRTAFEHG